MTCGSKDQDNFAAAGTDGVDGEFDLENPSDVSAFILSFFQEPTRTQAKPAVDFYFAELRKKTSKTNPLSHLVQKEIIKVGAEQASLPQFVAEELAIEQIHSVRQCKEVKKVCWLVQRHGVGEVGLS